MQCQRCGTTLEHAGQGHDCLAPAALPSPPAGWVAATWTAAGLAALLVLVATAWALLTATGADSTAAGRLASLAGLGVILSTLIWGQSSRNVVAKFGAETRRLVPQWGTRVFMACLVISFALQFFGGSDATTAAGALTRAFGAVALIADVLVTRARILRLIERLAVPAR